MGSFTTILHYNKIENMFPIDFKTSPKLSRNLQILPLKIQLPKFSRHPMGSFTTQLIYNKIANMFPIDFQTSPKFSQFSHTFTKNLPEKFSGHLPTFSINLPEKFNRHNWGTFPTRLFSN